MLANTTKYTFTNTTKYTFTNTTKYTFKLEQPPAIL